MPKRECVCGNVIFLHDIPCKHEWLFISDTEFDRLWTENATHEQVADAMTIAIKCEKCGRFWIYWDGFDNSPAEYVPVE